MPLINGVVLIRKLAEWVGFYKGKSLNYWNEAVETWHIKGSISDYGHGDAPNIPLTQSLDACFEWLVPKLDHVSIVMCVAPSGDIFWTARIEEEYKTENTSETPAMALCLAVSKLIDNKGNC